MDGNPAPDCRGKDLLPEVRTNAGLLAVRAGPFWHGKERLASRTVRCGLTQVGPDDQLLHLTAHDGVDRFLGSSRHRVSFAETAGDLINENALSGCQDRADDAADLLARARNV
jgi:hypothetical protein